MVQRRWGTSTSCHVATLELKLLMKTMELLEQSGAHFMRLCSQSVNMACLHGDLSFPLRPSLVSAAARTEA